ncbi:ester cyclase [Ruegeria lacuscaerulensis]|uniref:nuclear transport factor 2 family protein n=1 Tax=Ruegeria lacuscaerulensis TaxID=55218 RepID=UPI00147CE3B4|nr:ester cyclase [Ruegeria lacuscaerulensis]
MNPLSNRWKSVPDYILEITREIWEERGLETLNHYYAPDIPMRFPECISIGNQRTINGTLATLAEFPDRELTGEDVIWSGSDDEGYLSSHRLLTMGTHTGGGYFGPPTGKRFSIRAIADCAVVGDQINDEWLIRDTAGIVKQLGMEPRQFARDLIEREGGPEKCVKPFSPAIDVEGPYKGRGNDNEWGARMSDILSRMMNKDFAVIRAEYDRAVQTEHPAATTVHSWSDTEWLWMGLRSSFPNSDFKIEHQIGREDPMLSPRAAIRWSLSGNHDGWGMFGRPTGAEVYVMGFTHAEFGPYGLRREWTLFDPVSIWKQILMKTGDI